MGIALISAFQRILPSFLIFLILNALLRLALFAKEIANINYYVLDLIKSLFVGLCFDIATFAYFLIPYGLYLVLLPEKFRTTNFAKYFSKTIFFIFVFFMLFNTAAEWLFWDEFSTRFNFIAVDYIVYTHEVVRNIWESYPIILILTFLAFIAAAICFASWKIFDASNLLIEKPINKLQSFSICLLWPILSYGLVDLGLAEYSKNSYINELSKNGIFSLFEAFKNNELPYKKFYLTNYKNAEPKPLRDLLPARNSGYSFESKDTNDIAYYVSAQDKEVQKNVIIITMESLSAEYMTHFGNKESLTPNLDSIADESLFFTNTLATGTRTVRGLEAITMSMPPTPGTSIIKRQKNENLFTLGFIFKDRGYDTKFIYGGYGYFDNMNYFFENNGYDIIDRNDFRSAEQTFSNAWGLCDEDLYRKVIKTANESYAKNKKFFHMVMTTSNHRPYTFPENEAGIPTQNGGRKAGVKYADYAIGKFLTAAAKEPWFNDTIFIFVADHTAGSAGKMELEPAKYHIPLIIYAPQFIEPRQITSLTSQIDIAPTLLGIMNFSYISKFYGTNKLIQPNKDSYGYIASYQKLGFIVDGILTILKPGKVFSQYMHSILIKEDEQDDKKLLESISFYNHASDWRDNMSRIKTVR